ncbi:hypothetical protein [Streptomyces sp. URMC 125]|uniref:hypothetical protein n=1 Tax=Streptomyces sp. URMC 125 TaxID=3423419 RepID=UPI003F1D5D4F
MASTVTGCEDGDRTRLGGAEYGAALDETMEILRRWAREGRTDGWYKSLSEELRAKRHDVHYRGPVIGLLLGDACRRDSQGPQPMLSAIVILKATGRPAEQFFELANGAPFHRTAADWTWEQERARLFARYREG